jgi:hypothetical protein
MMPTDHIGTVAKDDERHEPLAANPSGNTLGRHPPNLHFRSQTRGLDEAEHAVESDSLKAPRKSSRHRRARDPGCLGESRVSRATSSRRAQNGVDQIGLDDRFERERLRNALDVAGVASPTNPWHSHDECPTRRCFAPPSAFEPHCVCTTLASR